MPRQLTNDVWTATYHHYSFLADASNSLKRKSENTDNQNPRFSTNFTFPTVEERVRYYIGDWYERTLDPAKYRIPCETLYSVDRLISDHDVLWTIGRLRSEIKMNRNWLAHVYLNDTYKTIYPPHYPQYNQATKPLNHDAVMIHIGDSHSTNPRLPVVAKTRFSKYIRNHHRTLNPNLAYTPIIWPLEEERHYAPVDEYSQLLNQSRVPEWKAKQATLVWRGAVNGVKENKRIALGLEHGPR